GRRQIAVFVDLVGGGVDHLSQVVDPLDAITSLVTQVDHHLLTGAGVSRNMKRWMVGGNSGRRVTLQNAEVVRTRINIAIAAPMPTHHAAYAGDGGNAALLHPPVQAIDQRLRVLNAVP